MAKSQQTFNKREREKKRIKKREDKSDKREQRKREKELTGKLTFDDQLSYVDEYGNLSSTPIDPATKIKVKAKDIILGAMPREESQSLRIREGRIKFFDSEKGYGFVIDTVSQESIFVHLSNCAQEPKENDLVRFEIEKGPKGPTAVNVQKI